MNRLWLRHDSILADHPRGVKDDQPHDGFDRSERRAQLMRDIADQLTAHGLDLLKLRCHLIEAGCKLCDLI